MLSSLEATPMRAARSLARVPLGESGFKKGKWPPSPIWMEIRAECRAVVLQITTAEHRAH